MASVDERHPLYNQFSDAWRTVRDCVAGAKAVKESGETYLPRVFKQKLGAYAAYRKRAKFFGATKRTLDAFVGFIFNKNPDWKMPATRPMKDLAKDATMTGKSLYDWAKDTTGVVVSSGRRGSLVDWAPEPEDRVYILTYEAEDIINWAYRRVGGRTVLSLVVLREMSTEWIRDPARPAEQPPESFAHTTYEQFRVIRLREEGGVPYVQVDIYRKSGAGAPKGGTSSAGDFRVVAQYNPDRRGIPLHRIPFVFHGPKGGDADPTEVPMYDMAEINLSHYRTSADLANARHVAGIPTPYVFGVRKEEAQGGIHLGTSEAIVSTKAATCGFLSYGGEGLASLEKGIEEDKADMAALGASMLDRQGGAAGKSQEAFETVQLRMAGTTSALVTITIACSQTLSDVLQWCAWWQKDQPAEDPEDLDDAVGVELHTEFLNMVMDSAMIGQLMQAYITGSLSYAALFWNFQRGGLIPSEKKIEDEIKDIEDSPIALPGDPTQNGNALPKDKTKTKPAKAAAG